jgi:hypothetical protein
MFQRLLALFVIELDVHFRKFPCRRLGPLMRLIVNMVFLSGWRRWRRRYIFVATKNL